MKGQTRRWVLAEITSHSALFPQRLGVQETRSEYRRSGGVQSGGFSKSLSKSLRQTEGFRNPTLSYPILTEGKLHV